MKKMRPADGSAEGEPGNDTKHHSTDRSGNKSGRKTVKKAHPANESAERQSGHA